MTYRSSYEVDLDMGFALLEKVEGPMGPEHFRTIPDELGFENLIIAGVYGGLVDPDIEQDFFVYNIQWPEELDEIDEDVLEILSEELDSLFPGWVYDNKKDRIYILQDPEGPPLHL